MADVMTRDEFEAKVIERAWKDPGFRERLVKDPKKTIEAEFGQKVAPNCEIVVIDESQGKVGIVIPMPPPAAAKGGALSDQELEKVAGGALSLAGNWRSLMTMSLQGLGPHSDYADTWIKGKGMGAQYADWRGLPGKGGGRAV